MEAKMHTYKTRFAGLGLIIALLGILVFNVGTTYAQGPGGNGRGSRGGQTGTAQMQQAFGGQGQQQANQTMQGSEQGQFGQAAGQRMQNRSLNQAGELGQNVYATLPPFEGELPAEVVQALTAGLLDEYNAYAVYDAVIAEFGAVAPFTSIQQAEAAHAAALERAFAYYGLDLPAYDGLDEAVTFTSVTAACEAGVEAEINNAGLYDAWLDAVSDYPDLVTVFTNLRDASLYKHLPAFENCAG
jgi:hypothetical protein